MDDFNNNEHQKVDLTKHTSKKVDLTKHTVESNTDDVNFFRDDVNDGLSGSSTAQQQNLQHLQHIESTNQQDYNQNQNYQEAGYLEIASLVCGILSLLCCCLRIFALILGGVAIGLAIASKKPNQNMSGLAIAGIITGTVGGFTGATLLVLAGILNWIDIDEIMSIIDICIHIKF